MEWRMCWQGSWETSLRGGEEKWKNMEHMVLQSQNLPGQFHLLVAIPPVLGHLFITNLLEQALQADALIDKIHETILTNGSLQEITVAEGVEQEGQTHCWVKCRIPESDRLWLRLLYYHDDSTLAGQPGMGKMFDFLDRQYYWKEMRKQIDENVLNCHDCQWSQSSWHSTFGVLRPLTVPEMPLKIFQCILWRDDWSAKGLMQSG